ncbi:MAG: LysM peptidoglycan-binding domain-containing protein [Hyphomonadaceae bacterium]
MAVLALSALGACSTVAGMRQDIGAIAQQRTPGERVNLAMELLTQGEEERARGELETALEENPGDDTARRLLEQIERDPRELLGERSRAYTARDGDTMSNLAQRFLGDPLLFYALSRYNDLEAPDALVAGQRLRIPQRAQASARREQGASTPSQPALRGATETPPIEAAAAAPPRPRGVDPSRANQLRLNALEQLNRGAVDRAVALLRQALVYDEHSPAIRADLNRALRIQASLRAG